MASSPVEVVLFDLDDTLCAFVQSSEDLLAEAFATVGVQPFFTIDDYQARYSDHVEQTETVEAVRASCFAELAVERGHDRETGRAVAAAYSDRRDYEVEPLRGAAEVVETLADRYTLGLVTNGRPSIQEPKLDSLAFTDPFETVVFAGQDVPAKPDPEPFHRALDRLDTAPERAVHVGDSLDSDVAGAHAAGVDAVWLGDGGTAEPEPEPDYVVETLSDLLPPPWEDPVRNMG